MKNLFALSHRPPGKARGSTRLGVRAVLLDNEGQVFLVRHTFVAGWHLPGGSVKLGESAVMALARELEERGNILLPSAPLLHGLFFNERAREHVACYVIRDFRHLARRGGPDRATGAAGFFAPDRLPTPRSRTTLARLDEVLHGAPIAPTW